MDDNFYHYSLPTALESDGIVYILQKETCTYALKYHEEEALQIWRNERREQRRQREMVVIRKRVELLVKMKKEL